MAPNVNYNRVFPRDLFNEAKLLKCIGRLALLILDFRTPCEIEMKEPEGPIIIGLRDDGFLQAVNVEIEVKGNVYDFVTNYNSKSQYPLFVEHRNTQYPVFDEDGEFDKEFVAFTKLINLRQHNEKS